MCLIYLLEPDLAQMCIRSPILPLVIGIITEDLDFKLDNLVFKLFQRPNRPFPDLINLLRSPELYSSTRFYDLPGENLGPVYFASLLGLDRVLQELISAEQQKDLTTCVLPPTSTSRAADVNIQRGYYGYPLQAASVKIVNLLVEEGADVNAQGGKYGNALLAASYGGHEKTVELLVENDADVNAQGT